MIHDSVINKSSVLLRVAHHEHEASTNVEESTLNRNRKFKTRDENDSRSRMSQAGTWTLMTRALDVGSPLKLILVLVEPVTCMACQASLAHATANC